VERLEKELGEADKVAAEFKRMLELADEEFKAELDETFGGLGNGELGTEKGLGVSSQELGLAATTFAKATVVKKNAESAKPWPMVRLGDVCEEIRERISVDEVALKNYITTDNMLKGCGGVRVAESVPVEGSLVKYQIGDVLISNIRPYLKKAWLADRSGGCSSDVIVFRSRRTDLSEEYLFKALSQDGFFEYSMLNVSGTKMPRGKREWIKDFEFPLPSIEVQKEIVAKLDAAKERCEKLKAEAERGLKAAENLRKAILSEAFE
jgi:restriction endonuclease S subunit